MFTTLIQHIKALFIWSEKLLRVDVRYYTKSGSLLLISQVVSAGISLGMTIAFANLVPAEVFGTYKYMLSVYGLLAIAAFPGIDTAVTQAVSRGNEGAFPEGFRKKMVWGSLATLFSFTVAGYYYLFQNDTTLSALFMLLGVLIPFMESGSVYMAFLNGKKKFVPYVTYDVITQAVSSLILLLVLFLSHNIFLIALAYYLPLIFLRLFFYHRTRTRYMSNTITDPHMMHYATSVTLFTILGKIVVSIDQVVLFNVLGPVQLAVFALARAVPSRFQGVIRIAGTTAMPRFADRDPKDILREMPRKLFIFFGLIFLGCLVYVALAPILFTYIFPKYHQSLLYSQVLVFGSLSSVGYIFSAYQFAHKKVRQASIISITMITVKVISLAIFVPLYGVWGAVISVLAESAANLGITLLLLARERRAYTVTS